MSLWVELRCSGPQGSGNGCTTGCGERGFGRLVPDSHEGLRSAYAAVMAEADAAGWIRDKKTFVYRCPSCAAGASHPSEIAGIAWEKYLLAIELSAAGKPAREWSGVDGMPTAQKLRNAAARVPELAKLYKSRPQFKPQGPKANPIAEDRWADVLKRFEEEEKRDICTGQDGWPTVAQWNARMERDEGFRERVSAIHSRRNAENRRKIDWNRALERFLSGESLCDIFGQPGMPNKPAWGHRLKVDAEFRAKVYARHDQLGNSVSTKAAGDAPFERMVELIRQGRSVREAELEPGTCRQQAFHSRVLRDPVFRARYDSALREARGNFILQKTRRGGERRIFSRGFTAQYVDWAGALEMYRSGAPIGEIFGRAESFDNKPKYNQWLYRQDADPLFAEAVNQAHRDRAEIRTKARRERIAEVAARKARNAVPLGTKLRESLSQNAIYAAVNSAVPRNFAPHVRDDVISAMVLDVLESKLDITDVARRARSYIAKQYREDRTYTDISLDRSVGDGGFTLIDIISSDRSLWPQEEAADDFEM